MSVLSNIREANPMTTMSGEQHGLMKVVGNSVVDSDFKRFKEKDRPKMESLRKEQSRMVKATYINTEGSHERLELTYCLWDGDPLLSYKFIPEQEYEIPKGLVDQVNNKKIQKRSDLLDKSGKPLMKDEMATTVHRFVPTGF